VITRGVESILARSLLDPDFLDALMVDPNKSLSSYSLDDTTRREFLSADFARIRAFSGFICKVQHNYLWESFPATRKLLAVYGLEIDLFSRYRRIQLSQKRKHEERRESILRFIEFLEVDLSSKRGAPFRLMRELLKHERATWETRLSLGNIPAQTSTEASMCELNWSRFQRLTPVLCGPLAIRKFCYDPIPLAHLVVGDTFDYGKLPPRSPRILGYWGDRTTCQLRVLTLDRLTAGVLCWINGRRSVRKVIDCVRRSAKDALKPRDFRGLFEDMVEARLLSLRGD
jgi:hypothetical protein